MTPTSPADIARLKPQLGLSGAVLLGLGSILGSGVFVSIGIAAGVAGPAVIGAVMIGALVALVNGLNSAQLAASHPVSGGTYEYGYRYLNDWLGFTAGWMFLLAKTASGATAALGFAAYLLGAIWPGHPSWTIPTALAAVLALTLIVLGGIRRSNTANTGMVAVTILSLVFFILAGAVEWAHGAALPPHPGPRWSAAGLIHASALMFVAYTGYARIATLGEEVHDPRRTIPRAILLTMAAAMLLYLGVATVAIGTVGSAALAAAVGQHAAPLVIAAGRWGIPGGSAILAAGAATAMLGVLLNLLLGLSRVLLAMGRRADMPVVLSRLDRAGATPTLAVVVTGIAIAALTMIGNVRTTWSFSAFTVLVYYAITNLAALRIPSDVRLYPRWLSVLGLCCCLFLAFWVDPPIWVTGLALILVGLCWHAVARRHALHQTQDPDRTDGPG